MGRYNENYWSNINMFGMDELWGCEITDSETGLVGSTHRYRSSKEKAYSDAWEDLQNQLRDYYESTTKSNNSSNYNSESSKHKSSSNWDSDNSSSGSYGGTYSSNNSSSDEGSGCLGIIGLIVILAVVFSIIDKSCQSKNNVQQNQMIETQTKTEEKTYDMPKIKRPNFDSGHEKNNESENSYENNTNESTSYNTEIRERENENYQSSTPPCVKFNTGEKWFRNTTSQLITICVDGCGFDAPAQLRIQPYQIECICDLNVGQHVMEFHYGYVGESVNSNFYVIQCQADTAYIK